MDIVDRLTEIYINNPDEGEAIAREFGLWDSIKDRLFKALNVYVCQNDVNRFIEYVFIDPETGDYLEQQDFHEEWQHLVSNHDRVLIAAPRGHGKCLAGDTKITLADGSRKIASDIPLNTPFEILSWDENEGYSIRTARIWRNIVQPIVHIKTAFGRSLRVSPEHPCWSATGWKTAKDIQVGDRLGVALGSPFGSKSVDLDKAWLLGFLIGDGTLSRLKAKYIKGSVQFTCAESEIIDRVIAICNRQGWKLEPLKYNKYGWEIRKCRDLVAWIKRLGIAGTNSHDKFVPEDIFTWNQESAAAFIEGYFDSDGTACYPGGRYRHVAFNSVFRELLEGIQTLLLRFGVSSQLTHKGVVPSWVLVIHGSSINQFSSILSPCSRKNQNIRQMSEGIVTNDNVDLIPDEVVTRCVPHRGRRVDRAAGHRLDNRRKFGHHRSRMLAYAAYAGNEVFANNARLQWDYVTEVIFEEPEMTYSVEVEGTHVHITNDFVTHNTVQTIGRIVWELGRNLEIRVKIIGSSDDKAKEILGLVKEVIATSERVHEIFPNLEIDATRGDTKTAFFVKRRIPQRDPSVEASGVLSTGAGGRADLLVCDDVVDLKNAVINPAQREQVIKAIEETWFALVASKGRIIWICTPYHVADATHVLKARGTFTVWWTPAIEYKMHFEDDGTPIIDPETGQQKVTKKILWPSKWSEEKLKEREAEVGTRAFARQYLLNAMSDEERTFPEKSLEKSFDKTIADIGEDIEDTWATYGGVDLATALGKKNAWTVITTLAKSPYDSRLYFKEIYRRRMPFSTTIKCILEQYRKHNWRMVYVENNQYQQAVIDALEEIDKSLPVYSFTTGTNKADERVGLPGLNVAFEKGHFAIPAAKFPLTGDEVSPLAILMNELRTHPGGEFSDTVMSLWFAWSAAVKGSGDFEDAYIEAVAS